MATKKKAVEDQSKKPRKKAPGRGGLRPNAGRPVINKSNPLFPEGDAGFRYIIVLPSAWKDKLMGRTDEVRLAIGKVVAKA